MTYLCVPIIGETPEQMTAEIEAARAAGAGMIELRLDHLKAPTAEAVWLVLVQARTAGLPTIATCRSATEGGRFHGAPAEALRILADAARAGADYIDVEHELLHQQAEARALLARSTAPKRPRVIISRHDTAGTVGDLNAPLSAMQTDGADVVKIACQAASIGDALRMVDALQTWAPRTPTIALSMGEPGILTRVLAKKLNAFLTFAALRAGRESAPGQPTIADLKELYRWDAIAPATQVYGVIGCPVAHSMSPAMHNAAFAAVGYGGVYLPLRVEPDYDSLAAFLDGCLARPWLDVRGFSVTIPHKENLLRYVREHGGIVEERAAELGVANTLDIRATDAGPARVYACNTDWAGALDALCAGSGIAKEGLRGLRAAVLGAGGAARAVVAALRASGCEVVIYNRTPERARRLAAQFGASALPWEQRQRVAADVIVNCTSIGMWPHTEDTPLSWADGQRPAAVVFDTVYNPLETRLLREARQRGCRTIDGLSMLVRQAAAQFGLWTGRPAPVDVMRQAALNRLAT